MSKEQPKLTDWFPSNVNPEHKGVYQAVWPEHANSVMYPLFAYWDGREWGWMLGTEEEAVQDYKYSRANRHGAGALAWRGLAVKP